MPEEQQKPQQRVFKSRELNELVVNYLEDGIGWVINNYEPLDLAKMYTEEMQDPEVATIIMRMAAYLQQAKLFEKAVQDLEACFDEEAYNEKD